MTENEDTLAEACKVAGIVAGEEKEIVELEKQIADKMRNITQKIFESTKFRIPKQQSESGESYYNFFVLIEDNIEWKNGNFYGTAKTLRVSPDGNIWKVFQNVNGWSSYDLGEDRIVDCGPYGCESRLASDKDIAWFAPELSKELIGALKRRIDSSKEEKERLKKVASLLI